MSHKKKKKKKSVLCPASPVMCVRAHENMKQEFLMLTPNQDKNQIHFKKDI